MPSWVKLGTINLTSDLVTGISLFSITRVYHPVNAFCTKRHQLRRRTTFFPLPPTTRTDLTLGPTTMHYVGHSPQYGSILFMTMLCRMKNISQIVTYRTHRP